MSKTTKRVTLALLLISSGLGGAMLYRRGTGAPPSVMQDHPAPPVAVAPPAPDLVAEPNAPPVERPKRASHERPSRPRKAVALAAAAAPASSEAAAPATAASAPAPVPEKKWGNISIHVRPRLGDSIQAFQIVKVVALVDGRQVSAVEGERFGKARTEVELWKGTLEAGEHALNIMVEYHGNGHSVFSYFDGYRYTARSSTHFRLDDGAPLQMTVDLIDKGGANTAFEQRLQIAFGPHA